MLAVALCGIQINRLVRDFNESARINMKLGIVIYSADAETVWNAFRLGVFSLKNGDTVKVFLLSKGVECESLDTDNFKVTGQMQEYVNSGGVILACGTCLKIRHSKGSELCPLSTMKDLYEIIQDSDKVISF
ncbi:MAG TPA: DsrE family protein [Candidatus Acidoferrales bacterium]